MTGRSATQRSAPRRHPGRARRRAGSRHSRGPTRPETAAVGRLDSGILAPAALLVGGGIVMIYSATAPLAMAESLPPQFVKHVLSVGLAVGCGAVAMRVPLSVWRKLSLPLWLLSLALLGATLWLGIEVNSARRWLPLPGLPFRLQPAELIKWTTVLVVASQLAVEGARGTSPRRLWTVLAMTIPPIALMLMQPDFGSAALLVTLVALLLFAAGTSLRLLAGLGALAGVGTAVFAGVNPYALLRFKAFIDPWQKSGSEGFQLVQSFVAFGRGGTFGVGLGDGRQKLFFLPEAHTDFILSVVAEELGLLGVLLVLWAFGALVVAGTRVARRARDPFVLLCVFGMTAFIAVPAFVNAAVVMGLVPTTGFPMPFLSLGGNSLLTCALALGILLRAASREAGPGRHRVAHAIALGRSTP